MPAKRLRTVACAGGTTQDAALKVLASKTASLDAAAHGGEPGGRAPRLADRAPSWPRPG